MSLVYRHNRVTRLTHWLNGLTLLILFMSGLQIFNAYPHLHWGNTADPERAFFSIYATSEDENIRGYTEFYGWRVKTTGFLGVQNTETGPSQRAFPSWLTIPGYYWLAGGRRWHFFFAWLFVLNGLLYFVYNFASGHLRKFFLTPKDIPKLLPMIFYYLRLRRESPQDAEYNPLQKMAYTIVCFVITPVIIVSGMAMSPQLDVAFNWLPAMFGGRQSARSLHFLLAFSFALFTFGHIFMVVTTGIFNNMRSMITGWYMEKVGMEPQALRIELAVEEPIEPLSKPIESQDQTSEMRTKSEIDSSIEKPSEPTAGEAVNERSRTEPKEEVPKNGEK